MGARNEHGNDHGGRPRAPEDVVRQVEDDGVEFIRLWFTDILGQLKSFAIGTEELEGALEEGMGFDGSSITGFNRIEESDMIAMPDADTYTVLPWRIDGDKGNVARMFCDILRPGGEPYEGDPRFVMRRALARAEELGFDTFNLGPELEYFYFASDELGEDGRADDPRQGRLLRPHHARRRLRPAPRHGQSR